MAWDGMGWNGMPEGGGVDVGAGGMRCFDYGMGKGFLESWPGAWACCGDASVEGSVGMVCRVTVDGIPGVKISKGTMTMCWQHKAHPSPRVGTGKRQRDLIPFL